MIESYFKGKTLLITGGTGSFGNAVLTRLLKSDIKEIRVFSRDEKKQDEMRHALRSDKVKFFIGDVRDKSTLVYAMTGVDYVFHAAALKQVPSCEFYPMEAVKTNILGTNNVLDVAISCAVERVVCLSTDKAAYPINAMGISKAMMEKVAISKSRYSVKTKIMVTRYGNVMASRGSVIPLFIEQLKKGRPLSLTDPDMTRFMMTLDDAVDLVLYAFDKGNSGDLFVQKAPAATVGNLAQALKDIFTSRSEFNVIGSRHGEKVFETLLTQEERMRSVDLGQYFKVTPDDRDLNYEKYYTEGNNKPKTISDYNSHNTIRLSIEELKLLLLSLDVVKQNL